MILNELTHSYLGKLLHYVFQLLPVNMYRHTRFSLNMSSSFEFFPLNVIAITSLNEIRFMVSCNLQIIGHGCNIFINSHLGEANIV